MTHLLGPGERQACREAVMWLQQHPGEVVVLAAPPGDDIWAFARLLERALDFDGRSFHLRVLPNGSLAALLGVASWRDGRAGGEALSDDCYALLEGS